MKKGKYTKAVIRRCFLKEACLKIHRKTPALESLFNKVAGLQLYKKATPTHLFFYGYCEIFKNSFFIEHLWWLFLVKTIN